MADVNEKWQDNAAGKYYIDQNCTMCAVCVDIAPNNVKESDDGDHCVVFKQPGNAEEEEALKEAIGECPTEAIGGDGK